MTRFVRRGASRAPLALLFLSVAACGDSQATPAPSPGNPNVITITAGGAVSPRELTVSPGSRVLFVNNHNRRHDMSSDSHPDHLDRPELNQVGVLNPGQSRETGNLATVRSCGFHDHDDPTNNNLRGTITVR